jgi:hypothetical protein
LKIKAPAFPTYLIKVNFLRKRSFQKKACFDAYLDDNIAGCKRTAVIVITLSGDCRRFGESSSSCGSVFHFFIALTASINFIKNKGSAAQFPNCRRFRCRLSVMGIMIISGLSPQFSSLCVQFKVRVIPDLVDTLGIQNFEKTATNFTKGFIFTRATRRPMRGDRRFRGIRGIRGVFNSLTRTSDYTRFLLYRRCKKAYNVDD